MFRLGAELKVYVHREAIDFRKSINGLSALVEQALGLDPFARAVYVFRNRRADRIKLLLWERNGICPHDGSVLVEIGVEVSEQLDIIPQQVRVIRHERVKYACPRCDLGIKVTPARARIIPKGLFSEAALSWFVVSKFMDGLPLYRIAALLKRFGGDISRNTLAASVVRLGEAVQPIINLMRDHLLDSEIVFGDETTVHVLKEPGRAPQTKSYVDANERQRSAGATVQLCAWARYTARCGVVGRDAPWRGVDDGRL